MIKRSAFVKIETLAERGVFQKDIAQELGLSDRTVRRALRRGGPHVLLERMKLEHLETRLDAICEGATQREMNYREFLAETLETEWSGRHQIGKRTARAVRLSRIPLEPNEKRRSTEWTASFLRLLDQGSNLEPTG